jgi:hypothetical protein
MWHMSIRPKGCVGGSTYEGTYREHYDVCKAKRALAIRFGAIPITTRELGAMLIARRAATHA